MCGRFALTATPSEVELLFEIAGLEPFPPRYNIAPTQPVLIVRPGPTRNDDVPSREAALVRWGLIPSWVKDPGAFSLLFNARSETAAEKPAFRAAMRHRRCLIPASGFYEWQRRDNGKQPFWISPADGGVVAFAGLWETWMGADGSEMETAAILTKAASPDLATIHPRMPVTLSPDLFGAWLDPLAEPRHVADAFVGGSTSSYVAVPVGDQVNAARNDGPDLQHHVEDKGAGRADSDPPKKDPPAAKAAGGQLDLF
ncbi:MAG: SOS response-associated peptidase [Pseudomonadota bacterium]